MKYDRKIHLTTNQLADIMGVDPSKLAGGIKKRGGPVALGRTSAMGRQQSFYCRFAATAWVDEQCAAKMLGERREKVPPRQAVPIHEQGEYRPSDTLSANFARAAEVYSHSLITPKGRGNHREFAFGPDRARLSP